MSFPECDNMNEWTTYVVLGGGYMQEDTLTNHSGYHMFRKLIFDCRFNASSYVYV